MYIHEEGTLQAYSSFAAFFNVSCQSIASFVKVLLRAAENQVRLCNHSINKLLTEDRQNVLQKITFGQPKNSGGP
jgi:radical SAM superfamily enzyme